jgi:hypothetical protein
VKRIAGQPSDAATSTQAKGPEDIWKALSGIGLDFRIRNTVGAFAGPDPSS